MKRLLVLSSLAAGLLALSAPLHAVPQWIWISAKAKDGEKATFRTNFTVADPVKSANLSVTCDNEATASLNGTQVAKSGDWKAPAKVDVTKAIKIGENTLTIDGLNHEGTAAVVAILTIETNDGKKQVIETGPDWQAAATGSTEYKPAVVIAKYGAGPWGPIFEKQPSVRAPIEPAALSELLVADGFKVELIYTVPKAEQGSWVSMTEDTKGRLIVGDQYGGLFRVTVPPLGATEGTKVEPLKIPAGLSGKPLGGAHGLLYAFDSLYLMNNEFADKGLWRLRDTDGDDQFDKADFLAPLSGGGEHGPHGVVLGPDGQSIYFVDGNHTKLPEHLDWQRPVAIGEDHLITRLWDTNGHAKGILAPGGYVCKMDPEGKRVELFAGGFRNQYDIAFDANGELFTYDSDMEWDMGSPWYMPTRINHIVSGGDYGWRSGAGRWPAYYADSLPAAVDIGPGSPTGTIFGTGAKFPAKYQRAFFALDWTYATIWAIHFVPDGASFKAEKEEFVAGRGFSVTDVVIRPEDGAMYVTVGGRRNQSMLYRITYAGKESTAPAAPLPPTPEAKQRHELEALQAEGTGPEAIAKAWPFLGNKDRFLRFAARIALEHQPAAKWADQALAEKDPQAAIEALIGLARVGDKSMQPQLLAALGRLDYAKLPAELHLPLLRAWELAFTRMGRPAPEVTAQLVAKLDPLFPDVDPLANRELVALLSYLGSPSIVAKCVAMLGTAKDADITMASDAVLARNSGYARAVAGVHESQPNRQAISYAYSLREASAGWTPQLRQTYFAWFPTTKKWKGGNSFAKFLDKIRDDALENVVTDPAEKAKLLALAGTAPPAPPANLVMPKGPGRNYTTDDVIALAKDGIKGRNFTQGKAMFASTLCINCHHFGGDGGNIGPDLTGAGARYTLKDLVENIVEPSKVISDQYGTDQIELKDGSLVVGRVMVEENGKLFVMTSPFSDVQTPVDVAQIKSRKPFNVSMMPPGLINALNKDELLDLIAYLQSGGNEKDKAFAP
ncbi:MAG TPA: c-type cytochrome [Chthoniobacteraceae bacterium]|jgi:putative heme-binding domain-containing protein|nr:c-type cytochrome [Chthoniobacteraceae bacterium]